MQRRILRSIQQKIAGQSNISDLHLSVTGFDKKTAQETISRLTSQIDSLYEQSWPLSIPKMATLLQSVEQLLLDMDPDLGRDLIDEVTNSLIKRFVHNDLNCYLGPELTKEDLQTLQSFQQSVYRVKIEQMKVQFVQNKDRFPDEKFETLEDYMNALSQKYQDNILLLLSNQKMAQLPLSLTLNFKTYQALKLYIGQDGSLKKRNFAQKQVAFEQLKDHYAQIEQALMENDIDYVRFEGNLSGYDIIAKGATKEGPSTVISRALSQSQRVISCIEFADIQLKSLVKRSIFKSMELEDNGNSEAVAQILETIVVSSQILNNLEVLVFKRIEIDERIMQTLSLIIRSNFIKELTISDWKLGDTTSTQICTKLAEAFSFNTSLISLELNSNQLTDEQGASIFTALLGQAQKGLRLQKLSVRDNQLSDQSASVLTQLIQLCPFEYLDLCQNQIVLRHLDSLLVSAAFKFNLEYFGIEENQKAFENKSNAVCSCLWDPLIRLMNTDNEGRVTYMKVTPLQIQNRNQRVIGKVDQQRFNRAKVNIRKEKLKMDVERFREQASMRREGGQPQAPLAKVSAIFDYDPEEQPPQMVQGHNEQQDQQEQIVQQEPVVAKKVRFDLQVNGVQLNADVPLPQALTGEDSTYTKFYRALPTVFNIAKQIDTAFRNPPPQPKYLSQTAIIEEEEDIEGTEASKKQVKWQHMQQQNEIDLSMTA